MTESAKWPRNKEVRTFLVVLDISGFSRHLDDPDQLLAHRGRFFDAVSETSLFAKATEEGAVKVHFLGDELRLAFHGEVETRLVRDFLDDVFAGLERINRQTRAPYHTTVKGIVLEGVVTWKDWHGCDFLDGDLPFKAQRWMSYLAPAEVVIDANYRNALQVIGVPTGRLPECDFDGETGYMLRP